MDRGDIKSIWEDVDESAVNWGNSIT